MRGVDLGLTVWVHDGEDVKVVFVEDGFDGSIGAVPIDELVSQILDRLARNMSATTGPRSHPAGPEWYHLTMALIHSLACTVPCQSTAGFPGPPLPHRWIPNISRP